MYFPALCRQLGGYSGNNIMATLEDVQAKCRARDPNQAEFLQAVDEVLTSLRPLFDRYPKYLSVLEAILEPERAIQFRIPWQDDQGNMQVNRGFRVQFNQAIGPYKGGLRFHPTVNLSIIKFLGFEQIFKNALTTLPMGGGKGGSDFDPKGKTDSEVLRFCQSFMTELFKHIGPDTDVPAGDIGVGGREIGFMFGQYKRITNFHSGVLTGKGWGWGGSLIRPEATGYGLVYALDFAMKDRKESIAGKKITISGSGNVAQFAAEKCNELGGIVLTFSDSAGTIYEPKGFDAAKLKQLIAIKDRRGRCKEYLEVSKTAQYFEGKRPWAIKCDIALPSATQNEIELDDAKNLVRGGCKYVFEGANMPSNNDAIDIFKKNKVIYFPAKAANAGGVAVSGLEMAQNSGRVHWTREEVDEKLKGIMKNIYTTCRDTAADLGHAGDFQLGANAAGFKKVADAMIAQGQVFSNKL
ncbi:NADP-specific glutamate dehydrogenase-like [Clavelina lepadiformis]|uniref:NADP-specific glutamate dehydrogenase-like n=1 Tax=Clavelina lepadiformis TaxID=159417 RepID=UPI0040417D36